MKIQTSFHAIASGRRSPRPRWPGLASTFKLKDQARMAPLIPPVGFPARPAADCAVTQADAGAPLIYAVDDEPHLTELYTTLLEVTGCRVRAFNDRVEALSALKQEKNKPALLIIDYLANSMLAEQFITRCLKVSPNLRILMASGLSQEHMRFAIRQPDRFLQKPFTPDEFLREVKATLNAGADGILSGVGFYSGR